jgi:hypothetical protein
LAEFRFDIETWTAALIKHVPMEHIELAYNRAMDDHTDTYPLNVMDIRLAYDKIMLNRIAAPVSPGINHCALCRIKDGTQCGNCPFQTKKKVAEDKQR